MHRSTLKTSPLAIAILLALAPLAATADDAPGRLERVEVTATRDAEPVQDVPASISIITDEQLRERGATDLRSALSLVAGVEISPGGDSGPAGAVPAFWGLREFDAFLLVVDGVPYGGAFNPQLTTLDLVNVERIEVMRGAAPVMYGATSFVGVIHVIHYAPGQTPNRVRVAAGTFGTVTAAASAALGTQDMPQSITVDGERRNFRDDDAGVSRGHLLYRLQMAAGEGQLGFDVDATMLRQDPLSPSPRAGGRLDPSVPIDANHNPSDARLDEDRLQFTGRYDRPSDWGDWGTTVSIASTDADIVRGFLAEDYADNTTVNANGYRQDRELMDVYVDTHVVHRFDDSLSLTLGADWMYGKAELKNELFQYFVALDGSSRPNSAGLSVLDAPEGEDTRNFAGAYVQADWKVNDRFDVLAGVRLNHTRERQVGETEIDGQPEPATDERNKTRLGGMLGASWHLWRDGNDALTLYGDVRNTYKPAALDFGPEAEANILEPETARSYEAGLKGSFIDGALTWDLSAFYMNFDNLVVAQPVDGQPTLVNAGEERFKGAEIEADYRIGDVDIVGHWAYHSAKFTDSVQLFGSTPTQLAGKYLELAPIHLGGIGIIYAPEHGFSAALIENYVGDRWLNKRNTARAHHYTTVDATVDYRWDHYDVRLTGYNLGDHRDPASESELGDAQYYRLQARTVEVALTLDF